MGLEGNLGGAAAAIADYFEHLAGVGVAGTIGGTALGAAGLATGGLVLEALLGEESLLGSREHELIAAVTAGQGFVLVHSGIPPQ